jgi:hypothetical protein
MSTRDARELCALADVPVAPETRHTPGPWSIAPYCEDETERLDIVSEYVAQENGHISANWIAEVNLQTDDAENLANARLIAMAPALLESHARLLKEAQAMVRVCSPEPEGPMKGLADRDRRLEWYLEMTRVRGGLRAAIAAAEKLAVRP